MNLKNQKPVFVPAQYWSEIEKISKAALMDMVWDLATRCSGGDDLAHFKVMDEVRSTWDIIRVYRERERLSPQPPSTRD